MSEESFGQPAGRCLLRNNVQHMQRRVHRLRGVLRALLRSSRWRSRPLAKNVRLLKRCVLMLMPNDLAQSTRRAYGLCYTRRMKLGLLNPAAMPDGKPITLRGWYYNRAALQFGFGLELLCWINAPEDPQDDYFGTSYDVFADAKEWLRRMRILLRWAPPGVRVGSQVASRLTSAVSRSASSIELTNALSAVAQVPTQRPASFKPAQSKRVGLSKLDKLWRQTFWKHLSQRTRYRTHIAGLILTGARPCEYESGMRVRLASTVAGDQLVFLIRGRKKSDTTGLSWRRIIVDVQAALNDPNRAGAVDHLVDQLHGQPRRRMVLQCTGKALNAAVSAVGAKAFPRHHYQVAPYSFRHQLATDLKVSDLDEIEFARILSHASTRTADHYGFAARGRRGVRPGQTLPVRSGGARGQVRIKHSAPPNWPSVRSAKTSKSSKSNARRKRP